MLILLIIIILLIISVLILSYLYYKSQSQSLAPVKYKYPPKSVEFVEKKELTRSTYPEKIIIENNEPIVDPIIVYDHNKIYDPLTSPTRRIPRHQIPPYPVVFNVPTQGYPDNYTQIGLLVSKCQSKCDDKILRLFGRQEYPRSNKYEYYTMIPSGNDQIKIPIKTRKNELYDDDMVYVKELGRHYKVQLHDYDEYKYFPGV